MLDSLFDWVDVVELIEHKDAVDPCDLKEAVDEVFTTDIRLEGRPSIKTVSSK